MRRYFINTLLIGTGLFAISCFDNAPDPGPVTLIRLEVLPSYTTDTRDNWIIASNVRGELLSSAPFESEQVIELVGEGAKSGNEVTITLASYVSAAFSASARDFYFFNSYTNIQTGSTWYLKRSAGLPAEEAGSVSVQLTGLPAPDYYLSVSSSNRRNGLSGNWGGETANVLVNLRKSPSDLFFSITGSDPRFLKLESVQAGENYSFGFGQFSPFDNTYPIAFSPITFFGIIQGFTVPLSQAVSTSNYFHEQSFYNGLPTSLAMGCNDGYEFYLTNWSALMPNGHRIGYYKIGSKPTSQSFVPLSGDFTMVDTRLNDTRFTATDNFVYCLNEWITVDDISEGTPITNWQVARPVRSQTAILTSLPQDFLLAHPYAGNIFGRLEYRRSNFVADISGTSYGNFISEQLGTPDFGVLAREWASLGK
jgi:hypothetical protein